MKNIKKKKMTDFLRYAVLFLAGAVMIYPLLWMLGASFKTNSEIFGSVSVFPRSPVLDGYKNIMNDYGGNIDLAGAMINTYSFVFPKIIFTLFSCTITAYGFCRFKFSGKNILFALLMATIFIPDTVMAIPRFIMFSKLKWIDSALYLPLVVPSAFAADTYFVFMIYQFMREIPSELDDAATIDGCSFIQILWYVICPVLRPVLVSCAFFQFIWSSNDFMSPLLYVSTPSKYPLSIFVKLSMDADAGFEWNRVFAISLVSIIPSLIAFFLLQKNFADSITAGAVKG